MNVNQCPKCGTEISAGAKFCQNCGYHLEPAFTENPVYQQHAPKRYPKAPLGKRFLAYLLDKFIKLGLAIPAIIFIVKGAIQLKEYGKSEEAILTLVVGVALCLLPLVYVFIKDGLGKGQSWGKQAVGLMVVYLPNNTPCTIGQSCLRGLVGVLLKLVPVVGRLIEPIMVLADSDGRRLADKAANTQVIDENLFCEQTPTI